MNTTYTWYQELIKPSFAPPEYLFGPVWTVLYAIIAYTFGSVFFMYYRGQIPFMVMLPFILNLIFNFIFTPIQFWFRSLGLASIDILLVLITLIWSMIAIYPYAKWVSFANIPYLLWVSFATILQLSIYWLNR
jgi:translocator protein